MPMPKTALPGDFFLVSFDGKNPNFDKGVKNWLTHGGLIRIGQFLAGTGFAQYEHAAVYIGGGLIVQAASSGVNIAHVSDYDGYDTLWSTGIIELTDAQRLAICAAAHSYVGVPYSWVDYAALAAHRLHLLPATRLLKNYVASSKHMICSQLVDQCYQDAGKHLFNDNRWPGYVMPGSLYVRLTDG